MAQLIPRKLSRRAALSLPARLALQHFFFVVAAVASSPQFARADFVANGAVDCQAIGTPIPDGEVTLDFFDALLACESESTWIVGSTPVDTRARAVANHLGNAIVVGSRAAGGSAFGSLAIGWPVLVFQLAPTPVPVTSIPLIWSSQASFDFAGGAGTTVATGEATASISRTFLSGQTAGGTQTATIPFDSSSPPATSDLVVEYEYDTNNPSLSFEVRIIFATGCDLFAEAGSSAACFATVSAGMVEFDQEEFDIRLGASSFDLSSYFLIALFPEFDPGQVGDIEWVVIDDPGNATDPTTGLGSVAETFRISATEITNAQYKQFLDAVAASDPNGLYDPQMSGPDGGITRAGTDGSYTYSALLARSGDPVNFVSYWDALRFANWLHNDQPAGPQSSATTEGGAYTLTPAAIAAGSVPREPGARYYVPDADEWLKSGYYDADTASWLAYPAGTNTPMSCALPSVDDDTANCDSIFGQPLPAGSHVFASSPFGTFDQGGNVREWIESPTGATRSVRGGGFDSPAAQLASTASFSLPPGSADGATGFRIAAEIVEPGVPVPSLALPARLALLAFTMLAGLMRLDVAGRQA